MSTAVAMIPSMVFSTESNADITAPGALSDIALKKLADTLVTQDGLSTRLASIKPNGTDALALVDAQEKVALHSVFMNYISTVIKLGIRCLDATIKS